MLLTTEKRYTQADYERLPEGAPYQLIGGELVTSPSPTFFHQRIITRLVHALSNFVQERHLGEVIVSPMDVFFTDEDVYQPDILFIRQDQLSRVDFNDRIHFAPDLVIEILSPSTAIYDYSRKKAIYGEHGVKEYWIVDPIDETVEIMINDGKLFQTVALLCAPATLASPMFPEFEMSVAELFAR